LLTFAACSAIPQIVEGGELFPFTLALDFFAILPSPISEENLDRHIARFWRFFFVKNNP
jgi:hypothetical protein